MPRPRKPIQEYGTWSLLRKDVIQFVKDWPGELKFKFNIPVIERNASQKERVIKTIPTDIPLGEWDLAGALLAAAMHPGALGTDENKRNRRELLRLYAAQPDFVLAVVQFMRDKLSLSGPVTNEWKTKVFLRIHPEVETLKAEAVVQEMEDQGHKGIGPETVFKARRELASMDEDRRVEFDRQIQAMRENPYPAKWIKANRKKLERILDQKRLSNPIQ